MKVRYPEIEFVGPGVAMHNQACAVYHHDTSAVFDCDTGVFHPFMEGATGWLATGEGRPLVEALSGSAL